MKSSRRKVARRKIANLENTLREMPIPRDWVVQTVRLLRVVHAGSCDSVNLPFRNNHDVQIVNWQPAKKLAQLPAYSRAKAWAMQLVLQAYNAAIAEGIPSEHAKHVARVFYFVVFGEAICGKTIRRLVAKIASRGGVLAPIEAYADVLSVPHRRKALLERERRR